MACPECNAYTPSYLQVCEPCIERKRQSRHTSIQRTNTALRSMRSEGSDPDIMRIALIYLLGTIVVLSSFTAVFLVWGPVKNEGPLASFCFAITSALALISFCTYGLFWARLLVLDPMWAVASLFLPCLVWRYLRLRWDDSQVRMLSVLHFSATILGFVSYFGLAHATGLSVLETTAIYASFMDGEEIDVTAYKQGAYDEPNLAEEEGYDLEDFES